ncbi:MAG TPA: hypothetical protein VF713_19380, partial [Thermoanaerobaculia bacterium]
GGRRASPQPLSGTSVRAGSEVAVMLGVLPQVVLTGPAPPAYAGSDLTFTATLVPPIPAGVQLTYNFQWNDGTVSGPTTSAVVTHRFADAARRVVSVVVVINDRVTIVSRIPVDMVAVPPPSDTTQSTTAPSGTTGPTDTVASTETQSTGTTQSTTTPPTETAPPTTTTSPTTTTVQTTTVPETPPKPTAQTTLLLIGVIAIILLLTAVVLLVRLLRKVNRTPPAHAPPASPLSIKGSPGPIEYEIEHPEQIRHGPTVRLRGGIRPEAAGEGGDDA